MTNVSLTWNTIGSSATPAIVVTSVWCAGIATSRSAGAARRNSSSAVAATGGASSMSSRRSRAMWIRDPVDAVAQHLDHRRELLDERDAGVGDVVLVPLRAAQRDPLARLAHEILEAQVVERLQLERHGASSAGTT